MIVRDVISALQKCPQDAEFVVMHYSAIVYHSGVTGIIERETIDHATNQVHHQVWAGDFAKVKDPRNRMELGLPDLAQRMVGDK